MTKTLILTFVLVSKFASFGAADSTVPAAVTIDSGTSASPKVTKKDEPVRDSIKVVKWYHFQKVRDFLFPEMEEDGQPKESVKWQQLRELLGRLEAEFDRVQVVTSEVNRLKNTAEDLRTVQLYPEAFTGLVEQKAVKVDKMIKRTEKRISGFGKMVGALRTPLGDAIGMLNELIYEDQQPEMLELLVSESMERVREIIRLKRQINTSWSALEAILDTLYKFVSLPIPKPETRAGFDAEFFQVLNSNLGLSSDLFSKKLGTYKDKVVSEMDLQLMGRVATMELFTAINRYNRGEFGLVERDLLDLAKRFDQKIVLNGVYFYLGQVSQALDKKKEAINYYNQISQTSKYFIPGFIGALESVFSLGDYARVIKLFELTLKHLTGHSDLNKLLFIAAQSYYDLGRDSSVVEVTSLADKNRPFYGALLYVLGQSYARTEDFSTAGAIFKKLLDWPGKGAVDRQYKERAKIALAHLNLAEEKFKPALSQYVSMLGNTALFAEALEGIAWSYLNLKRFSKAEIALKRLVNQAPWAPSGCDALLTISKNLLSKAQREWRYKKAVLSNAERIGRMLEKVDLQVVEGELDSVKHAEISKRLNRVLSENKKGGALRNEEIGDLFREAVERVDFLLRSYNTGEFIQSNFANQRQEILLRVQDLLLKSRTSVRQVLAEAYFAKREQLMKDRGQILTTVQAARRFKVKLLLAKQNWERDYGQILIPELNKKIAQVKADSLSPDSLRLPKLAKLMEFSEQFKKDLGYTERLERKEILNELLILRESQSEEKYHPFVLYYLGEMYYRITGDNWADEDEKYQGEVEAYDSALVLFEADSTLTKPEMPELPPLNYSRAKQFFRNILENYKNSEYTDAAMYSLMFCHLEEGDRAGGVKYGHALVEEFSTSQYAPQTFLILGEYYFDESKLELALKNYREVLKFPESRWFDKALYKMGWTYYRLSEPTKAISSFFFLINEQDELAEQGLNLDLFFSSLLIKEAVDYVAISFAETDTGTGVVGLKKARRFVRKIRNQYIGSKILHKLGDVYREQLKYGLAITTYRTLRSLFPNYREMPRVWYSMIEAFEQRGGPGDFNKAMEGRESLFQRYNRNSKWAQGVQDTSALAIADSIAEQAIIEAAGLIYSRALETKNKDQLRKVMDLYWEYIKTYPNRKRAGECHYYIAEILFGAGDYLEAAREYMEVSKKYRKSKYAETAAMNAIVAAQNLIKAESPEGK